MKTLRVPPEMVSVMRLIMLERAQSYENMRTGLEYQRVVRRRCAEWLRAAAKDLGSARGDGKR